VNKIQLSTAVLPAKRETSDQEVMAKIIPRYDVDFDTELGGTGGLTLSVGPDITETKLFVLDPPTFGALNNALWPVEIAGPARARRHSRV